MAAFPFVDPAAAVLQTVVAVEPLFLLDVQVVLAGDVGRVLDGGDDRAVPNADQNLDLYDFPHIRRLEPKLSEDHAAAEFEQALEDLLDRLDRFITA